MSQRQSWHEYFMTIAKQVASRSTCLRRHVGAVMVKDRHILATGYNGAPTGTKHCTTCLRQEMGIPSGERHEICRASHAEMNAIVQAAKHGVSLEGSDLYCTTFPCSICAKLLINVGVRRVYYSEAYRDRLASELMDEAGIQCILLQVYPEGTKPRPDVVPV